MKPIPAVLFCCLLAGCVEQPGGGETRPQTCPAPELQHLVDQPRSAFDRPAVTGPVRILPPGAMMTMDHRPDRLNVELDENGNITRVWCG